MILRFRLQCIDLERAVDPIIFRNFVFAVFLRDVVLAVSIWKNWNWGCLVLTA